MVWAYVMGNTPNISDQKSPFINQNNAVISLLVFLGYVTQARGCQFVEVSLFKYMLRLIIYLDSGPSQV